MTGVALGGAWDDDWARLGEVLKGVMAQHEETMKAISASLLSFIDVAALMPKIDASVFRIPAIEALNVQMGQTLAAAIPKMPMPDVSQIFGATMPGAELVQQFVAIADSVKVSGPDWARLVAIVDAVEETPLDDAPRELPEGDQVDEINLGFDDGALVRLAIYLLALAMSIALLAPPVRSGNLDELQVRLWTVGGTLYAIGRWYLEGPADQTDE